MRGAALALLGLLCGCNELRLAGHPAGPTPSWNAKLRLPEIQRATLPSGLRLYVIEDPYLPLVSVHLAMLAGSAAVPPAQAGLPALAYRLLLEGSESRDVDLALEALGAEPRVNTGPDGAELALTAPVDELPQVLELLGDAVQHPRLAEQDFARLKRTTLLELGAAADQPFYAGWTVTMRAIYGPDHPYGAPPPGTPSSVSALGLEDVVRFHRRFTGPRNAALVLSGRVSMAQALSLCQRSFGAWAANTEAVPVPPEPAPRRREGVLLVPRKGLPQVLVLLGKQAVPAGHEDELPLRFVYGAPAAWSSSWLRSYQGVTYGVNAGLSTHRGAGHVLTLSWLQADALRGGLRELLRRHGDVHDLAGGTYAGTYEARARAALGVMYGLDSLDGAAHAAASLFFLGRREDYYQRLAEALMKLQAGELHPVAYRHMGTDTLQVVLVGDPDVVRQQIGPLYLGPLREVTSL